MNNEQYVIERTFNAPAQLVYEAWTDARHMAQWWGPKGFDVEVFKLDLRPGGVFHYVMRAANGSEMWGRFEYCEIVAPERIVFVNSFADKEGNIVRAPFFDGKWPLEVLCTLTLTETDGKTKLSLTVTPINATADEQKMFSEATASMNGGYKGTFDKLDDLLAKQNHS